MESHSAGWRYSDPKEGGLFHKVHTDKHSRTRTVNGPVYRHIRYTKIQRFQVLKIFSVYGAFLQSCVLYTLPRLVKSKTTLPRTRPVFFTYSCDLFHGLASPHLSSHYGHSLTDWAICSSFLLSRSNPPVVTGIPTDVN